MALIIPTDTHDEIPCHVGKFLSTGVHHNFSLLVLTLTCNYLGKYLAEIIDISVPASVPFVKSLITPIHETTSRF